ncbi:MAG: hypothetical protein AB7U07_14945, partial [Thermoleophilia bacterium]
MLFAWKGIEVHVLSTASLQVSAQPDPGGLPGQDKLQGLVNGLYSWSLILVLAALVVAAVAWA